MRFSFLEKKRLKASGKKSDSYSLFSQPQKDTQKRRRLIYSYLFFVFIFILWFPAMSATVITDPMMVSASPEAQSGSTKLSPLQENEVESVKCECCGLIEDYTLAYIETTKERYHGKWVCGLCGEAIKDEVVRAERLISTEEAMTRHMNFCKNFKSSVPPPDPTAHFIAAMRQILKRSLDSPRVRGLRSASSMPSSPVAGEGGRSGTLSRSESCFPTLSG